jgi:hypothetical protein
MLKMFVNASKHFNMYQSLEKFIKVPIFMPIQNPHKVSGGEMKVVFHVEDLQYVNLDTLIATTALFSEDKSSQAHHQIKAELPGIVNLSFKTGDKIQNDSILGTLSVKVDLADIKAMTEIVKYSELTTHIAVRNDNDIFQEGVYCRVGISPGYEHFELVLNGWAAFLSKHEIPKEYHSYEYFLDVMQPLFNHFQGGTMMSVSEQPVQTVTNFNFQEDKNVKLFHSKMPN